MIARKYIALAMLFMPAVSKAQHKTEHTIILWAGYNNTVHFNKKWSLASDAQLRTKDGAKKWLLYAFRTGLSYNLNDHVAVAGGITLFKSAQYAAIKLFFKNEWRPWQNITYQLKLKKINTIQRLRAEERFLQQVVDDKKTTNYQFIFRLRYRFELQFPLEEKSIYLLAGNEILVNPGYLNNSKFFDQNRTFAGVNLKLNSNTHLQFQYIKIFQWYSNTSVLEDQNAIRLNIYQQFNSRKYHKPNKIV